MAFYPLRFSSFVSKISVLAAGLALVWLAVGFGQEAKAQEGTGVSIAPLTFELNVNPGEQLTNVVRVYNNSATPLAITMEVQDFAAAGEKGEVVLQAGEDHSYSLAKWVSLEPQTFILEPKSFKPVEFKVTVPPNGEPGGHYGSILAALVGTTDATGAAVAQKVGSLLLLQVAGDVKENLTAESLEAPGFSEYGPVMLAARFKNSGSVHLKPRGFVLVKSMFGNEVARLDIPQQNVLPRSIRRVDIEMPGKWHWGRYSATLTAIYGSANEPLSVSVAFWIFPWKVSLAVLVGLLIILYVFYRGRRRLVAAGRALVKGN